jgi:CheY-like chemotaxis protein
MTILYIDDDAEDREVFKEAVAIVDPSIICYLANDGQAGLDTLQELISNPDMIFVDVNMPVKNGKEFLVEIKKLSGFKTVPVILYSTTSHSAEIKSYSSLGAHDFVIKPNTFGQVCEIIASAIRGEKVGLLA